MSSARSAVASSTSSRNSSERCPLARSRAASPRRPSVPYSIEGRCRVEIDGSGKVVEYRGGQRFEVPGKSGFRIETLETLHYVCHFG